MHPPLRIHPQNPRYFEFRGRPVVLICATEHYGSVLNRRFDFVRYLHEHATRGHTLTRLFLLFREQQSSQNPSSPCKPESPDFIAPWPRTGPGRAQDGEPKYDLERWNDEYFDRLHRFMGLASELGVVVEATLFSNSYNDHVWALNPLKANNNLQEIGAVPWAQYNTLLNEKLVATQRAYTQKLVAELNPYNNLYLEICNEPGTTGPKDASTAQVDEWQEEVLRWIHETEAALPQKHLVSASQAFEWDPFKQDSDASFGHPQFDVVNIHPLPNTWYGGREYDMGGFMSKQLRIEELRNFTLAVAAEPKPCVHDEDNIASCYRDTTGWTIHRKRAWVAVLCGAHYDVIDFSIVVHAEDGTPDSRRELRSWLGHLSRFIHAFDVVRAQPLGDWLTHKPAGLVECTLVVEGEDYAVYLCDPREVEAEGFGSTINGTVRFTLPPGKFAVSIFSPVTGAASPGVLVAGGGEAELTLPAFAHDIVVRVTRQSA